MRHRFFSHVCPALFFILTLVLCSNSILASELASTRLKDTIRKGYGDIDVLKAQGNKAISPAVLESFRQDNSGDLVFGVDVNEAANGSEKADSQGVAIESLVLTVETTEAAFTFTDFETETKSVVAPANEQTRREYYTLIGRTGSNNLTGSGLNGTSFDATLTVPVSMDLSSATAVTLSVTLLETNVSLGDPEAFYDFTAGFEDLAIVTESDSTFLNSQAAGRDEAPLVVLTNEVTEVVAELFSPSADSYYLVAYEDEYPQKGDYDLNDLVVAYRVTFGLDQNGDVKTIAGEGYLVARGGLYDHDWHLRIPINVDNRFVGQYSLYSPPGSDNAEERLENIDVSSDLDIRIFANTRNIFIDPESPFVNTVGGGDVIPGDRFDFNVSLENAIPLEAVGEPPYDPYLFVNSTGYEVHLTGKSPVHPNSLNNLSGNNTFVDGSGFPFAYVFPETWRNPLERVDVGIAYPELLLFIESGREDFQDWYLSGSEAHLSETSRDIWLW